MGMLDAVDRNRAFVGLQQPVQHVHQRCLACPVFTKQAMDFTGRNVQVDRVVGDQVAEPLGDPRSRRPVPPRGPRSVSPLNHAEGCDLDSIVILPLMMSALSASSSDFSSAGTLESNSWNGARPVPSFSRVPT